MPECGVCGGIEFTPHDGFFYCTVCQTQSQDLRQHEMSFRMNSSYGFLKSNQKKPRRTVKKRVVDYLGSGPAWTTWQALNFILKGLTDELIALGAPAGVENVVLQIWACYLRVNEVAFTSMTKTVDPKLSFPFRYRDGKVIFDIDTFNEVTAKNVIKRRAKPRVKKKGKKFKLSYSARKMRLSDYESHSNHAQSQDDANVTLESLTSSSKSSNATKLNTPKKMHMSKRGYHKQKRSENVLYSSRYTASRHTLLCIIHTALIITHSQIQLSDLLRYIREGYLSYSILSHFLPADLKFGIQDAHFINSDSDRVMPTHTAQRLQLTLLSGLLKFRSLPTPDLPELLKRYALDLLLPDELADLAVRLLCLRGFPAVIKRRPNGPEPMQSFELLAIAPLLVTLKFLFGLDGVTERQSSHFADCLNRNQGGEFQTRLFSWCQWQRAVECRKTVLTVWHYPTREMVDPDALLNPKDGLKFLQTIHKDPYIRDRVYQGVGLKKQQRALEKDVEDVLEQITSNPTADSTPTFRPSLTPGITLLHDLISWFRDTGRPDPAWMNILVKDWASFRVDYLLNPEPYLQLWQSGGQFVDRLSGEWLIQHMSRATWMQDKLDRLSNAQQANKSHCHILSTTETFKKKRRRHVPRTFERPKDNTIVIRTDHSYWRLTPSEEDALRATPWDLVTFEDDVMPQFPSSWSWLLRQCSYMLHITPRDIYMEVLSFEEDLMQILGPMSRIQK